MSFNDYPFEEDLGENIDEAIENAFATKGMGILDNPEVAAEMAFMGLENQETKIPFVIITTPEDANYADDYSFFCATGFIINGRKIIHFPLDGPKFTKFTSAKEVVNHVDDKRFVMFSPDALETWVNTPAKKKGANPLPQSNGIYLTDLALNIGEIHFFERALDMAFELAVFNREELFFRNYKMMTEIIYEILASIATTEEYRLAFSPLTNKTDFSLSSDNEDNLDDLFQRETRKAQALQDDEVNAIAFAALAR